MDFRAVYPMVNNCTPCMISVFKHRYSDFFPVEPPMSPVAKQVIKYVERINWGRDSHSLLLTTRRSCALRFLQAVYIIIFVMH